ncbi:EndoU domain-containing protein, partial [Paenibacillus lautus]|uniref:EndoU domain-containing protein n=1 Tax=Paenibacillus lautus TaxID=1401 RepID=UPI003D2B8C7E
VTGLMLGAVDLAILGKTLLKRGKTAANTKYMNGIDQISTPKTRFKRGQDRRQKEMAMRVRQAVEESRAIRRASKDKRDLYFKKEKELYEALKKKKTSSSGSFEGTGKTSESYLSPEMEQKILGGERIPGKNGVRGGHSPNVVNNANPNYAVEVLRQNPDGTNFVQFYHQFPDGTLAKLKKSTVFPDSWSDEKIISSIKKISDTPPVGSRTSDGVTTTLHSGTVDGVEIDVIKEGNNITAGYPVGGKPTPGFEPIN